MRIKREQIGFGREPATTWYPHAPRMRSTMSFAGLDGTETAYLLQLFRDRAGSVKPFWSPAVHSLAASARVFGRFHGDALHAHLRAKGYPVPDEDGLLQRVAHPKLAALRASLGIVEAPVAPPEAVVVGTPFVVSTSLTATGTPPSGPSSSPAARRRSTCRAAASAPSASTCRNACTCSSTAAIRSRWAWATSAAEASPLATRAASCAAVRLERLTYEECRPVRIDENRPNRVGAVAWSCENVRIVHGEAIRCRFN